MREYCRVLCPDESPSEAQFNARSEWIQEVNKKRQDLNAAQVVACLARDNVRRWWPCADDHLLDNDLVEIEPGKVIWLG